MRILGIDPGTGICGFGIIEVAQSDVKLQDAGTISTPPHTPLPDRLKDLYESFHELIDDQKPDTVSIEKLFFSKNITTGITVAEARGVILLVCRQHNLPTYEYTPNEIKKTLTGYGNADKKQVQEMVKQHLKLNQIIKPDDASDALAAAITHSLIAKYDRGSHNAIYQPSN